MTPFRSPKVPDRPETGTGSGADVEPDWLVLDLGWCWDWLARRRRRTRWPGTTGWCVRVEWPDGRHDLIAFHPDEKNANDDKETAERKEKRAEREMKSLRRYWQLGPVAPTDYRVVEVSWQDWRLHAGRGRCGSPDCPR